MWERLLYVLVGASIAFGWCTFLERDHRWYEWLALTGGVITALLVVWWRRVK